MNDNISCCIDYNTFCLELKAKYCDAFAYNLHSVLPSLPRATHPLVPLAYTHKNAEQ